MNYSSENSFAETVKKEEQFDEFFKNIKAVLRQCNIDKTSQKWNDLDRELHEMLE